MMFAVVVGVKAGPMIIRCGSIAELTESLRTRLKESERVLHEVGLWAIHAKPGDYLDWEGGWIFACSQHEPHFVRADDAFKVKH